MHGIEYPETIVKESLWKYVSPVLIIFGTFGNILSIYVLNRRHRSGTSTSKYLTSLAVSDVIVLLTGLLRHWIIHVFGVDIRSINGFLCKFHMFVVSLSCQYSSWCLVIVTAERVLCVWKPHTVKVGCTKKLANVVMWTLLLVLVLVNSHLLVGFRLRTFTKQVGNRSDSNTSNSSITTDQTWQTRKQCVDGLNQMYAEFAHYVWPCIDAGVVFAIPFVVLLFGNVIILRNLRHSRRFRRQDLAFRQARITSNISATSRIPLLPMKTMLLMLNSIFFLTVGPITVFSIGQFYWWPNDIPEGREMEVATLTWAVINILMYSNNAVNFVLYIMCGSEFRKEVQRVFSSCCHGYSSISDASSVRSSDSRIRRVRSSTDFTSSF